MSGRLLEMRASGLGDTSPAEAALAIDGRAILPPSPVHPVLTESCGRPAQFGVDTARVASAGCGATWPTRRWPRSARPIASRSWRAARCCAKPKPAAPGWTYAAADRADDLAAAGGEPIRIEIRQLGTFGPSRPLIRAHRLTPSTYRKHV